MVLIFSQRINVSKPTQNICVGFGVGSTVCDLGFCLFYSTGQLVGAGSVLKTAANALQTADQIVCIHTFCQCSNALRVAMAAANDLDVLYDIIFQFKTDGAGAHTLVLVFKLHFDISFLFGQITDIHICVIDQIIGGEDQLLATHTGRNSDFVIQLCGLINERWIGLFHTDGAATAADIAGQR